MKEKSITAEESRNIRLEKEKQNSEIAYRVYDLIKDMEYRDICKLIEFIEHNFKNQKNELKLKVDDCLKRRTDFWF